MQENLPIRTQPKILSPKERRAAWKKLGIVRGSRLSDPGPIFESCIRTYLRGSGLDGQSIDYRRPSKGWRAPRGASKEHLSFLEHPDDEIADWGLRQEKILPDPYVSYLIKIGRIDQKIHWPSAKTKLLAVSA